MRYDAEARRMFHSIKAPIQGFRLDVVEFDTFILLRFYYSQWTKYTKLEQARLLGYLDRVQRKLSGYGLSVALDPVMDVKNVQLQET